MDNPCYGNGTCNDGLSCIESICRGFDASGARDAAFDTLDSSTVVDANDFTCANDSEIEPNESLNDPTLTGIPQVQNSVRLVGLAICPSTDQDFFRFDIAVNATDASLELEYQANRGTLRLDLLNNTGASISSGVPVGGNDDLLRASVPSLPTGTYFAHIRSAGDGTENNYTLEIITNP